MFQELFQDCFRCVCVYNIFSEKLRIRYVNNINLLHELPFYDELSIVKILNINIFYYINISQVFKGYVRNYNVIRVDSKDSFS